jgi:site-specific DNA-cytosine methylase
MLRLDTSSEAESHVAGKTGQHPPRAGTKRLGSDSPLGSRIMTSSDSSDSDGRPRGRGGRGSGAGRKGSGKRGAASGGNGRGKRGKINPGRDSHGKGTSDGSALPPKARKSVTKAPQSHRPQDRIMTSESASDHSSCSSEVSRETARIREVVRIRHAKAYRYARAGKTQEEVAAMCGKGTDRGRGQSGSNRGRGKTRASTSSSESDKGCEETQDSVPATSGVFDYIQWVVDKILTDDERNALCKHSPISIGSMCSGMGTEDLVCRAIENAMLQAGRDSFKTQSIYKAESDDKKIAFLKRHTHSCTHIFPSNASLAHAEVEDVDGQIVARPSSKILTAGIVCIDISSMSSTPQPVSGVGKSGESLQGLLESLRSMSLAERPILVILECVPRLSHHRKVDPDHRTGAQFILDELSKLGYVGEWRTVRPRNFYLPQSRDRVYALNLLRDDFTEASAQRRRQDLDKAFQMLLRMQLSKAEPLACILMRLPSTIRPLRKRLGESLENAIASGKKWPSQHNEWADAEGLSKDARIPPSEFVEQVSSLIPPRSMYALWLKLARMQNKSDHNWKHPLLVAPTAFSISYSSRIIRDTFPCITPGKQYLILESGKARLACKLTMMALQGIQNKEVHSYSLAQEDDKLLRDLAGNAFTANIIAAFLIAGAAVM